MSEEDIKELKKFKEDMIDPTNGVIKCVNDKRLEGDSRLHIRVDGLQKEKVGMKLWMWLTGFLVAGVLGVASYTYSIDSEAATKVELKEVKTDLETDIKEIKESQKKTEEVMNEMQIQAVRDKSDILEAIRNK